MTMSHASSAFAAEANPFAPPGGEDPASSDEEEATLQDPKIEHMITLVGNVRQRPVFILTDTDREALARGSPLPRRS